MRFPHICFKRNLLRMAQLGFEASDLKGIHIPIEALHVGTFVQLKGLHSRGHVWPECHGLRLQACRQHTFPIERLSLHGALVAAKISFQSKHTGSKRHKCSLPQEVTCPCERGMLEAILSNRRRPGVN